MSTERLGLYVLVDNNGDVKKICDVANSAGLAVSPNGRFLATVAKDSNGWTIHRIAVATGTGVALASLGPVDEPWFRSAYAAGFTPDGSRVVAVIGYSSFSVSINGGPWMIISRDHGSHYPNESVLPDISPDSRIIADRSEGGTVVSIDGGPPHAIRSPDGNPVGKPIFEPRGGLNKAVFYAPEPGKNWMANADGTGNWLELASGAWCEWSGRIAICQVGRRDLLPNYSYDLFAVTDDGKQIVTLARNGTSSWAVIDRSLFYVPRTGGLYVIDGLPQP